MIFLIALLGMPAQAEMKQIPGGSFAPLFGADKKKASVRAFSIDRTPVTNDQYLAFVRAQPKWRRSKASALFVDRDYLQRWKSDLELGALDKKAPVTQVSWFGARAYCRWRGKRLPTVLEWEYVAAASKNKRNATADPQFNRKILEWYSKPTGQRLPRVGTRYPANIYGVMDLHGVIWEWNRDFNTALVTGESRGDSDFDRKLYCGSGAVGAADFKDYAAFMRWGFRSSLKARYTIPSLGFRCAKN